MKLTLKIWKYIFIYSILAPHLKRILPSVLHQKLLVFPQIGYWPQIREPRTFNEKILHRKLFTENEQFSTVEDKWQVRDYVSTQVGEDILADVYYLTDDPSTIPFDELPDEFVIKPTHLSGPVRIVDKKATEDWEAMRNTCERWLSQRHGEIRNEYWYSSIKPRVIVEERLRDDEHDVPLDFKFFVFHGEVKYIQVDMDRFSEHSRRLYDREWNPLEVSLKYPKGPVISEPEKLDKMVSVADQLGDEFDFIRVDLYQLNDQRVVFGELTVGPGSGEERFKPVDYDFEFGSHW